MRTFDHLRLPVMTTVREAEKAFAFVFLEKVPLSLVKFSALRNITTENGQIVLEIIAVVNPGKIMKLSIT